MNQRIHVGSTHPGARLKGWMLGPTVAVALCLTLGSVIGSPLRAQAQDEAQPGYSYTVQAGDSWGIIAELIGLPVDDLRAANPDAVRDGDILILGESLFVPVADAGQVRHHAVSAGESWNSIAAKYDISVQLLRAVNPRPGRTSDYLYRGETLLIPPKGAAIPAPSGTPAPTAVTATPTAAPTSTPTLASTVEATATAAAATPEAEPVTTTVEVPAAAPDITATVVITDGVEITSSVEVTAAVPLTTTTPMTGTAAAPTFDLPPCPERFADYAPAMTDLINSAKPGIEAITTYLSQCDALVDNGTVVEDLNGDGVDDLVVVYENPSDEQIFTEGDLAIFNSGPDGYALAYRARAAGEVRLLAAEDINADDQPDVVWVDTTCGASTCFDTVNVRSWDGASWADWTEGTITMAYAEINLVDQLESGQGEELVLDGGIYGSVGAGPQRSRTEVWASIDGAPYSLVEKSYSASECLYHTVLDANRAFLDAPTDGFEGAQALYTRAATDEALIKCWVRNDELAELRSFSRFRLAVIAGYQDDADTAASEIATLSADYPGSIYDEVGQVWLEAYQTDGSAVAACQAVTTYVGENSAAWEMLADYGYTNPSFEAADVCPLLDLGDTSDGGAEAAPPTSNLTTPSPALAGLPACPVALDGYADGFAAALDGVGPDQTALSTWLSTCGALAPDRGAVVVAEINGDGVPDLIGFPALITDIGYGPGGAQGAVFIFHSAADGGYDLIADPPSYGLPAPLAVDDLNADGRIDVAWTVTGCADECVLRVEIYTWDADAYVSLIDPGATLINGAAAFTPTADGAPGSGQQLVLTGGVSDLPEGGLAVPHTELWQSVDGGLYRRIAWTYDDTALGSDCLGLKLVEADVTLHAADLLGYGPAVDAYTNALAPLWRACSIFGLAETEELTLLQGLASFRLIQAQALGGDVPAATTTLNALIVGQPDRLYPQIAQTWLEVYDTGGDPAAACAAVRPLLAENPELWQITDHFGYNHPALGVDQVCYTP